MTMTRNALTASAVAAILFPVSLGALLWRSALHLRDVAIDLDPFEVDLQLHDRNDEA